MRSAWVVATLLLSACAGMPGVDPSAVSIRPANRSAVLSFRLEGRMAVRQDETRHHVRISWSHSTVADELLVSSPLGQGIAELVRDASGARLTTAEQRVFSAPDWEALFAEVFGFHLPLAGLPRWLLADLQATAVDDRGRPQSARAGDWAISYLDYESEASGALPVLMEFRRQDLEIRLKVDSWDLSP